MLILLSRVATDAINRSLLCCYP